MSKSMFFGCGSLLLLISQGCKEQPETASPLQTPSSIVTEINSNFSVLHEAQIGQTLEWRIKGSGKTDFFIFFGKQSPCSSRASTLHGSADHPATCVVGRPDGGTGTVQYTYELHQDAPPPGGFPDRIGRCLGCTD